MGADRFSSETPKPAVWGYNVGDPVEVALGPKGAPMRLMRWMGGTVVGVTADQHRLLIVRAHRDRTFVTVQMPNRVRRWQKPAGIDDIDKFLEDWE